MVTSGEFYNSISLSAAMYCLILYAFLKIYFKRKARTSIKEKLEFDEEVICDITPFVFVDFLFAFAYGHSLSNLFYLGADNFIFTIWRVAFALIGLVLLVKFSQYRTFVTNKRIIAGYKPLNYGKPANDGVRNYYFIDMKKCCEKLCIAGTKFFIEFNSNEQIFTMYAASTLCYKPAVEAIKNIFSNIKEIGYEKEEKLHQN